MTILDNSAVTAFAVWAVPSDSIDILHAVFATEELAIQEATSCNMEDPEHCYRVVPVTYMS